MVLFSFSDMADKKKKIANSFWKTSNENKLSKVVKSIERWVMDTWKREKKKSKDETFLCNDIAQIIREICVISRRQLFNTKKSPLQL